MSGTARWAGVHPGPSAHPKTHSIPARNADLHGLAPDTCPVALVIVDVLSDFDFPDGDRLLEHARPAAKQIAGLKRRAKAAGVPVVYVNDNAGRWQDDIGAVVRRALRPEAPGRDVAERLLPGPDDYAVLKPKHSAFYQTPLDTLLKHLGTQTLVLTGFTGDVCLLATALDANMRDFRLVVPADATASMDPADNDAALAYLQRVAEAETPQARDVEFEALAAGPLDAAWAPAGHRRRPAGRPGGAPVNTNRGYAWAAVGLTTCSAIKISFSSVAFSSSSVCWRSARSSVWPICLRGGQSQRGGEPSGGRRVVGRPPSQPAVAHISLSDTTDWQLADDAQDIRGYEVLDATGDRLGRVAELVVDTATETVSTVLLEDGTGVSVAELTVGDGLVTVSRRATEAIAHKGLPAGTTQTGYSGRVVKRASGS